MNAYKIHICQMLKPTDLERRVKFCKWLLEKVEENSDFLGKLFMSDKAHFSLNGHVNRQDMRFWVTESPHQIKEVPLLSERVTVWCGFMENCIIGPYFFENENNQAFTVNDQRYNNIFNNFIIPAIERMNLEKLYLQQDGARLCSQFPGQLISRFGDVE